MLFLIGAGLQPQHLTLEALQAIEKCSTVFLESYTSQFSSGSKKELEKIIGKKIASLNRKQVEEEFLEIVQQAKKENIALLVIGNPLTATTHLQILLEAQEKKVSVRVIPGISIVDFVGKTGLDAYKFGRICTIVFQESLYKPESFFDTIETNYRSGLHSLCLLDIRAQEKRLMTIPEGIQILQKIAEKRMSSLFNKAILIGLFGMAGKKEKIVVGNATELLKADFEIFPQSLIVCGKINEKEKEALQAFHGWHSGD